MKFTYLIRSSATKIDLQISVINYKRIDQLIFAINLYVESKIYLFFEAPAGVCGVQTFVTSLSSYSNVILLSNMSGGAGYTGTFGAGLACWSNIFLIAMT